MFARTERERKSKVRRRESWKEDTCLLIFFCSNFIVFICFWLSVELKFQWICYGVCAVFHPFNQPIKQPKRTNTINKTYHIKHAVFRQQHDDFDYMVYDDVLSLAPFCIESVRKMCDKDKSKHNRCIKCWYFIAQFYSFLLLLFFSSLQHQKQLMKCDKLHAKQDSS